MSNESKQEKSILLILSRACEKHRQHCHHHHHDNDHDQFVLEDETTEQCHQILTKLREVILPQVEKKYSPEMKPFASDVGNLCDFYCAALNGTFCPLASQLFKPNQTTTTLTCHNEVSPRLKTLFHHLISRRVIQTSLKGNSIPEQKICSAIARFLLSSDTHIKQITNLSLNLSVISEANLIQHHGPLIISLFHQPTQPSNSSLQLKTNDELIFCQGATFKIILSFLKLIREHRQQRQLNTHKQTFPHKPHLLFTIFKPSAFSSLLASIRHIILKPHDHSTPRSLALLLRSQKAAFQILNAILDDWNNEIMPSHTTTINEVALIVSRSIRVFASSNHNSLTEYSIPSLRLQISAMIARLLWNCVIHPPIPPGRTDSDLTIGLRSLMLPDLLRSLETSDTLIKFTPLLPSLLHCISACLWQGSKSPSQVSNFCSSNGIFTSVVHLLTYPGLRDVAVDIVTFFLLNSNRSLETMCLLALAADKPHKPDAATPTQPSNSKHAGSSNQKKATKRKSSALSPKTPLQISVSPKRSRTVVAIETDPSSALQSGVNRSTLNQTNRKKYPTLLQTLTDVLCRAMSLGSSTAVDFEDGLFSSKHKISSFCGVTTIVLQYQSHQDIQPLNTAVVKISEILVEGIINICAGIRALLEPKGKTKGAISHNAIFAVEQLVDTALKIHFVHTDWSYRVGSAVSGLCWDLVSAHSRPDFLRWAVGKPSSLSLFLCTECLAISDALLSGLAPSCVKRARCFCRLDREPEIPGRIRRANHGFNSISVLSSHAKLALLCCLRPVALVNPLRQAKADATSCPNIIQMCYDMLGLQANDRYNDSFDCVAATLLAAAPLIILTISGESIREEKRSSLYNSGVPEKDVINLSNFPYDCLIANASSQSDWKRRQAFSALTLLTLGISRVGNELIDRGSILSFDAFRDLFVYTYRAEYTSDTFHEAVLSISTGSINLNEPAETLQAWNCFMGAVSGMNKEAAKRMFHTGLKENEVLNWMIAAPFVEKNFFVRSKMAREFGQIMLGNEAVIQQFATQGESSEFIVRSMFKKIDKLLYAHSSIRESQLPSTLALTNAPPEKSDHQPSLGTIKENHFAAVSAVTSLCHHARVDTPLGLWTFGQSWCRLIRIWSTIEDPNETDIRIPKLFFSAIAFSEMRQLDLGKKIGRIFQDRQVQRQLLGDIFKEILCHGENFLEVDEPIAVDSVDQQYKELASFIGSFQLSQPRERKIPSLLVAASSQELFEFTSLAMQWVFPSMVIEMDYEALLMATGFKIFSMKNNSEKRLPINHLPYNCIGAAIKAGLRPRSTIKSKLTLAEHTATLCSTQAVLDQILARVLVRSRDRHTTSARLKFLIETVLRGEKSLNTVWGKNDKVILKWILIELEDNSDYSEKASRGVITDATTFRFGMRTGKEDVPSKWISTWFMYCLVNVVQKGWREKDLCERRAVMRSLKLLLTFLIPKEAPPFLPQIFATIGMATGHETAKAQGVHQRKMILDMLLLSAECLSVYVKSLISGHVQVIGENLSMIVVLLLPMLSGFVFNDTGSPEEDSMREKAHQVSVDLLETLTAGKVGKQLAVYLKDVPFVPKSPYLETVHNNLKAIGINFDEVLATSQTNQSGSLTDRDSMTSDNVIDGDGGSKRDFASNIITAMQTRLTVLQPLIKHENVSVRVAVLQYLLDLLSANRVLFYRIVETEEQMSLVKFVTLRTSSGTDTSKNSQVWYGTATKLVETLLNQSTVETDTRARSFLASCLGEIGAIDPHKLGPINTSDKQPSDTLGKGFDHTWQLKQPPWQSTPERYQLQLLTKYLVLALKTATSPMDQHKIAFTIQQLLVNLDRTTVGVEKTRSTNSRHSSRKISSRRKPMNPWLCDKLKESNVYDIVEPYWHSTFREVDVNAKYLRKPPLFKRSKNYSDWISHWCRFLISSRTDKESSKWGEVFYSLRTAVRSPDGRYTAEFILPLLILDRLCCCGKDGAAMVIEELKDVLDTSVCSEMPASEKNKAISTVFVVLDTLEGWADHETEEKSKKLRGKTIHSRSLASNQSEGSGICSADDCLEAISSLRTAIPLDSRAKAATLAGMHPRSLRYLEMSLRSCVIDSVFEAASNKVDESELTMPTPVRRSPAAGLLVGVTTKLVRSAFGNLHDFSSVNAIHDTDQASQWNEDSIAEKEARGDWSGALNEYERSLQTPHLRTGVDRSVLEKGVLRCLLKLGQYESVLNQVGGIRSRLVPHNSGSSLVHAIPFGIEAAWRLGRWSELTLLVKEADETRDNVDATSQYYISLGKAMLALESNSNSVAAALESGRAAVLSELPSLARESYPRAYQCIVNLHCLREIEDAWALRLESSNIATKGKLVDLSDFESASTSRMNGSWAWEARLQFIEKEEVSDVLDTRLSLSRIFGAHYAEAQLHALKGTNALKKGLYQVASHCFGLSQATLMKLGSDNTNDEAPALACTIQMELARLMYTNGDSAAAFRLLDIDDTKGWGKLDPSDLRSSATQSQKAFMRGLNIGDPIQGTKLTEEFTKRLLQTTKWMVDGRLKSYSELLERFQLVTQLATNWEEGHFEFAKFADAVLEARLDILSPHLSNATQAAQGTHARHLLLSEDMPCQDYLILAIQQYISAIKLDSRHIYQALPRLLSLWFEFTTLDGSLIRRGKKRTDPVQKSEDPLGFLLEKQKELNDLFRQCVRSVPAQSFYTATPQLISRVNHRNEETGHVVNSILYRILTKFPGQAMWAMAWLRNSVNKQREEVGNFIFNSAIDSLRKRKDRKGEALLIASKSFVQYFTDIAKYVPREKDVREFTTKVWTGEVEIGDFVPPVQAALSSPQDGRSTDLLPRMRTLQRKIQVMHSKARPKRIKFLVVPGSKFRYLKRKNNSSSDQYDVGELHFLVKQEAKGDLRKDARVQNLNVVINRLFASSATNARDHKLHLTTFAVTCLSEDCGILEWVPNTDSMRNSLSKSYNPLASPYCLRRRGKRSADFTDPDLRQSFEKSQNIFIKGGDLSKATESFEKLCLSNYPPVFYWWFVQQFPDPYSWYEARSRYTLSVAVWSAVGHIIGLGDRHSENLLMDTATGACVHVDFDCIFDKGLSLPRPEVVPFRLTPNMLDAMGPVGADGMFASSLKSAMSILRDNMDILLSVLEPFLNDPIIDWRRIKSSQRAINKDCSEAKRSIKVIEERLLGVYNLRNPNYKKVQRIDKIEDDGEDMMHMLPLSVEGQVQKMITEAVSHENLVQLYVGWMPWI